MGMCISGPGAGGGGGHDEVLFFPDEQLPCRKYRSGGCTRNNCKFAHSPTSLSRMLDVIDGATTTIDICVFSITCDDIADRVIAAHERGVRVRIVTDDDQKKSQGSDIARMQDAGIKMYRPYSVQVCDDNSPHHMHNKFALIDRRVLLNGSFNWTRSAVLNNRENVVISTSPALIGAFQAEFDKLWGLYHG